MADRPALSIIIPVFNDSYLAEAVEDALSQQVPGGSEIVVVDHGSTDGTAKVADRLAAKDRRVRVFHLPDNTGGPGRPMNHGIDQARGRYLTFIGSDDGFEPDSLANLLSEAETGCDLVVSDTRRVFVDQGTERSWLPELYEKPRRLTDIREHVDQMADTIPGSKLFRTDWLRRAHICFPEDMVYEDLPFMAQAYVRAGCIAVVPQHTARWNTRVTRRPSLTMRRNELTNVADRIRANVLVDEILAAEAPDLRAAKDDRFLTKDLHLFLPRLWSADAAYRRGFCEIVGGYVAALPPDRIAKLPQMEQLALRLLALGDVDELIDVWDHVQNWSRIRSRLEIRDGRVWWPTQHGDDPQVAQLRDVTDLDLIPAAFSEIRPAAEVETCTLRRSMLEVSGVVTAYCDLPWQPRQLRARLQLHNADDERVNSPAQLTVTGSGDLRFAASVDLGMTSVSWVPPQEWRVTLSLTQGNVTRRLRLSGVRHPFEPVVVPVRALGILPLNTKLYLSRFGNLTFSVYARPGGRRSVDDWFERAERNRRRATRRVRRHLRRSEAG